MAKLTRKPHLLVSRYSESLEYKYPRKVPVKFKITDRVRAEHGKKVFEKLASLEKHFLEKSEFEVNENLIKDDVLHVQFFSAWGFELMFDQLHDKTKLRYQILNIKKERHPEDENKERYVVLVMMRKGGVSHFMKKAENYITENTFYKKQDTGNPVANKLIANIEDLKIATLEAFWTDSQYYDFPERDQNVWWEIWFKKSENVEIKAFSQLETIGVQISQSRLEFGENIIRLVKGTAKQLSDSLMLLDSLMEIRKPQEMNDFIMGKDVTYEDQKEWMEDLNSRTNVHLNDDSVLVCLLDTGINNKHALLKKVIPDEHLYTYKAGWGVDDTCSGGGHGTGMAGLVLYGDLTDTLSSQHPINIYHGVESFKVIWLKDMDEMLFGSIYQEACSIPIIDRPKNPRVYCLSVTNGFAFRGRPSAHSAALDAIAFGQGGVSELIFVSGGTLNYNKASDYPDKNYQESIPDPGQAYNIITVGSFTRKDKLVSGSENPVASFGGMSPNNSTSVAWESKWPNKPEIVFEGGNLSSDGTYLSQRDELKPLSIDKEFPRYIFLPFDGTCSATAFASKMAAELRTKYPNYWPETIRGLMIHSAEWTSGMLGRKRLKNKSDIGIILRSVGYGVPRLEKALFSSNNSLTMISENTIYPYKLNGSQVSYNEYHLYSLPWPKDVLRDTIAENDVRITITLSYFIEPNPGQRQYANSFSYHSHDLDFKLIKPTESLDEFKRRLSSASKKDDEEKPDLKGENWTIGERLRNKGSIKKDYLETNGVELSQRYYIGIYPKKGWYRTRKALQRFNSKVRYSLIVSIETPDVEVDIYTPVETLIKLPITL